jgi:very-short-patch-repair endonuclease
MADDFEATARILRHHVDTLADVAAVYGMPAPTTLQDAFALRELTTFARAASRPEERWLQDDGRAAAHRAADELERDLTALAAAKAAAADVFNDKVLTAAGVTDLAGRFAGEHHGLRRLTSACRADKRLVAELTVSGECDKAVIARLPQAVAWQEADARLRESIAAHSAALGGYWAGPQTDLAVIRRTLEAAARIAELASNATGRTALANQVTAVGRPDLSISDTADSVLAELAEWRARLVPAPRPGGRPRLAQGTLTAGARWYAAHVAPLRTAAQTAAIGQERADHEPAPTVSRAREIIARIEAHRRAVADFEQSAMDDRMLLGDLYSGQATDLQELRRAVDWAASVRREDRPLPPDAARALLESQPNPELAQLHGSWRHALSEFCGLFEGRPDLHQVMTGALPAVRRAIGALQADTSGPEEWHAVRTGRATLRAYDLDDLVDRAAAQELDGALFRQIVERSVLDAWVEHHLGGDRRFGPIRAVRRDRLVEEFRHLDKALVQNAHADVIGACNARRPRPNVGQTAILQKEAQKKSRHMPVRSLLERTSDVAQRVKPCFMMSPLTVSQFLPPSFRFDVVIFDEASQVLPQDAINCIYRGDSLIVAGDQKQLPPTDFFARTEEEDDEYDEDAPDSFESLLDMCKGTGLMRSLSLRWHYRSRHESLIAFSNSEFYDNELVSFPSARETGDDIGVTFTKVDGVYDRGKSRSNVIEARAVAERVLQHYTSRPDLSVGVIAMSDAQARVIDEAVEDARRERPDLDRFFADDQDRLNGFFVKNLETVQGDERDVILLSVGYGPDSTGKIFMAFGPLNRQNGWRRLNVAITRARQRVEVISSLSGGDIREGDNASRNHFKRYLDYAERGPVVLSTAPVSAEAGPESPFEESVLDTLEKWGYDVQPQVGVAGYRIDLAVRHPDQPGRYALGIECDGAMYHSSRAARDRDRLREEVLRGLGWTLHRIWGTDWYRERAQAEQRLRAAVDEAISQARAEPAKPVMPPEPVTPRKPVEPLPLTSGTPVATVEKATEPARPAEPAPRVRMVTIESDPAASWSAPYRRARVGDVSGGFSLDHPRATPMLMDMFRRIIEVEAPINQDVLFRRVAEAWGIGRIGDRIRGSLLAALRTFLRRNRDVVRITGGSADDTITLRDRSVIPRFATDDVSRRVNEVPVMERETALLRTIEESPGISEVELKKTVARLFGWRRMGGDINAAFRDDLTALFERGLIEGLPHRIRIATSD